MARIKIFKKDGKPTPFFWSDKDPSDRATKTVYKLTDDGVKKMRGVHFDVEKNQFNKH